MWGIVAVGNGTRAVGRAAAAMASCSSSRPLLLICLARSTFSLHPFSFIVHLRLLVVLHWAWPSPLAGSVMFASLYATDDLHIGIFHTHVFDPSSSMVRIGYPHGID